MANRIIKCQVANEFIKGAGQVIGAAGSHNDVELELEFSPLWDGTSKSIIWFDALGENPILTALTPHMLVSGGDENELEREIYRVPIPAEPKAIEGNMRLTIKGVEVVDGVERRAVIAATAEFKVLSAVWDPFAEETQDITPTQAEQFLAELDAIKEDITNAMESAEAAATSEANAKASETAAAASQAASAGSEAAAKASQEAAAKSAASAGSDAATAGAAMAGAQAAQSAAEGSADAASTKAAEALASQQAAATSEGNAKASETSAAGSAASAASNAAATAADRQVVEAAKTAAETANAGAKAAQTAAEGSAKLSESWAVGGTGTRSGEDTNNSKYWALQAAAAAGGGVSSFNGRSGVVKPQSGDYTADMVGARPDNWMPTAAETGAAAAGHTHTPESIGAAEAGHAHSNYSLTTHSHTAVDVGAIPSAEKGAANGIASLDESGKVPSGQLPAGTSSSYYKVFTAADWSSGTLTIPAAEHGLSATSDVMCQVSILSGGVLVKGTWAGAETYATVDADRNIVLHYSGDAYDGAVLLIG